MLLCVSDNQQWRACGETSSQTAADPRPVGHRPSAGLLQQGKHTHTHLPSFLLLLCVCVCSSDSPERVCVCVSRWAAACSWSPWRPSSPRQRLKVGSEFIFTYRTISWRTCGDAGVSRLQATTQATSAPGLSFRPEELRRPPPCASATRRKTSWSRWRRRRRTEQDTTRRRWKNIQSLTSRSVSFFLCVWCDRVSASETPSAARRLRLRRVRSRDSPDTSRGRSGESGPGFISSDETRRSIFSWQN